MEARTKVAAAAASVIPFSCIICFDEFNPTERPPMVLPCGHTYVCLPCTKRLRKCMECREPLFLPAKQTSQSTTTTTTTTSMSNNNGGTSDRYPRTGRYSPNPPQPPCTPTKSLAATPLPIPKNVVLLALMEAAERQSNLVRQTIREAEAEGEQHHFDGDEDDGDNRTDESEDEEEEEEETYNLDHIITSMATMAGPCGTYAVRDPDGLSLYAHDPREGPPESVMLPQISTEPTNSLIDEEKKQDDNLSLQAISADDEEKDDPKMVTFSLHGGSVEFLAHGQRVQVVSFEDGVAKLARGRGYVRATRRQLVKIGGPLDESCRLEGLLDTVRSRGSDLLKTLQENQRIEDKIQAQLLQTEEESPDCPVISEPPAPELQTPAAPTTPDTPSTPPIGPYMSTPENSSDLCHREHFYTPTTDYGRYIQGTNKNAKAPHSPASIDNSDIMLFPGSGPAMPRYGASASFEERENHLPIDVSFGCGVGLSLEGGDYHPTHRPSPRTPTETDPAFQRPHFRTRASSSTDPTNLTPSLTSSFDGVDFRTGLSGHRGLSHARKLHMSPKPRSSIRMMGEHRGIAHSRPSRASIASGGLAALTATSISSTLGRPYSTVPALGPRFSSPSSTS